MAGAAISWTRDFLDAPIVGSSHVADTDYGWQLSKQWSGRPDLEWTAAVMPERFTAMTGRVRAYSYEDVRDFETVRSLLRVGSNLLSESPGRAGGRGQFEYPSVALGFRYFESAYRSPDGHLRMPAPAERFRGRHYVVAIDGYDMRRIRFMNSWGNWGDHGYGYIDEEYFDAHVETAFVRWSGASGPSPTMSDWLDRAHAAGIGYPLNLLVCWRAPNKCQISEVELHRRAHTVMHWQVVTLEDTSVVDAYELRNGARIIGRLHVRHTGVTAVITEIFVVPRFRGRGYGSYLESLAAGAARDHGATELQAWLRRGDDRVPVVAGSRALARARGYSWTETRDKRPTLVATATRSL